MLWSFPIFLNASLWTFICTEFWKITHQCWSSLGGGHLKYNACNLQWSSHFEPSLIPTGDWAGPAIHQEAEPEGKEEVHEWVASQADIGKWTLPQGRHCKEGDNTGLIIGKYITFFSVSRVLQVHYLSNPCNSPGRQDHYYSQEADGVWGRKTTELAA